ncbi:MAG: Rab family GTPase [Candidatus Promineifilaceae bacterium]
MITMQKKICLLGDFAVGKTSLVRRFVEGRFDDKYLSTIGVKISRKAVIRPAYTLNMIIWDLAGGEDFSRVTSGYLMGVNGALLVCDLTRPSTLLMISAYVEQIRAHNADAPIIIVANKLDLEAERQIDAHMLANTAVSLSAPWVLTSAKTGSGVIEAFDLLADKLEELS